MKSALQTLEAEIVYSREPLVTAFIQVASQTPNPIAGFFEQLHFALKNDAKALTDIWDHTVCDFINQSALGNAEKEILIQFGQTLGRHDVMQQKKYIQLALTHFERLLEEAIDDQRRYSKMFKSLGLLTGIFIVLFLM